MNQVLRTLTLPLLLLILFCGCTDSERSHHALTELQDYYVTHKSVCDSLEDLVYHYYLKNGYGRKEDQDLARLFHAERLYDNGLKTEALELLMQIDEYNLPTTYFRSIKYYLMGEIYITTRLNDDALQAFRKESELTLLMHDNQKLATAYNHVAHAFINLGQKDSAWAYYNKNLSLLPFQDSISHAIIYNNIAVFYEENFPDSLYQTERHYLNALRYAPEYYLAMANLADLYYQAGQTNKADSLIRIILHNNESPNTFTMTYGALHDQYLRTGQTDSAYKYEQLAMHYDSIVHLPKDQKKIVRITEHSKGKEQIKGISDTLKWGAALSAITVASVLFLFFHTRQQGKTRMAEETVRRRHLEESLECLQEEIDKKTTTYKTGMQSKGREVKKKEEQAQSLVEHIYLPSQSSHSQNPSIIYQTIITAFVKKKRNNKTFLKDLCTACPSLSLREQTLCILLSTEHYNDDTLCSLLHFISKPSYYTAKSRLRSKLQKAADCPAVEIVLQRL